MEYDSKTKVSQNTLMQFILTMSNETETMSYKVLKLDKNNQVTNIRNSKQNRLRATANKMNCSKLSRDLLE